jgi:hypothetical protein
MRGRRAHRLGRELHDLAGSVLALQRREIHHRDREPDRRLLGLGLDRPLAQHGGALVHADPVDRC